MNREHHANRYYKSLCLCDKPMPGKFARDLCGECGGIIPRYRQWELETEAEKAGGLWFTLAVIVFLVVILAAGTFFPSLVDGAVSQIGR